MHSKWSSFVLPWFFHEGPGTTAGIYIAGGLGGHGSGGFNDLWISEA